MIKFTSEPTLMLVIAFLAVALLFWVFRRRGAADAAYLKLFMSSWQESQEKSEKILREEMSHSRFEATRQAQGIREELGISLKNFGDSLQGQMMRTATMQKDHWDDFARQLAGIGENNERKLEQLREIMERRLQAIQDDNTLKLEQMRNTVDEKLQGTLEKRLAESFRMVSERLEQVHQGLGDMRHLAVGVGDLKRVLTNVKARGGWGEVQLGMLLEDILAPEQFGKNIRTNEHSLEVVEYAVKLPGQAGDGNEFVWLPIDAKVPIEDYQRLLTAQEQADPAALEKASRLLASALKLCARDIHNKYLNPPCTTDFAIMYLPMEGLYAEVARQPSLMETIRRDYHVIVAGPSSFAALLNSLQMGFRTLAIQKRSGEIWNLLAAIKTEFGKFGSALEGVRKKLAQAQDSMDDAARKSRGIERKLRDVQELPPEMARSLLPQDHNDANLPQP